MPWRKLGALPRLDDPGPPPSGLRPPPNEYGCVVCVCVCVLSSQWISLVMTWHEEEALGTFMPGCCEAADAPECSAEEREAEP